MYALASSVYTSGSIHVPVHIIICKVAISVFSFSSPSAVSESSISATEYVPLS